MSKRTPRLVRGYPRKPWLLCKAIKSASISGKHGFNMVPAEWGLCRKGDHTPKPDRESSWPQKDVLSQEETEDSFKVRQSDNQTKSERTDAIISRSLKQEVTAVGSDDQAW